MFCTGYGGDTNTGEVGTQLQQVGNASLEGAGAGHLDFDGVQAPLTAAERSMLCIEAAGSCAGPPQAAAALLAQAQSLCKVRALAL